jgi:hypothetical protein
MMQPAQPPDRTPVTSQAGGPFCSPEDLDEWWGQVTIFDVLEEAWPERPTTVGGWDPWPA